MTDTEQRESEALQGNAAGKPYTGRMFNGNIAFITGSIEDAKSIESITNTFTGAAALDTFSGMDLANTLAEWNGPDGQAQEGTAIICLDNTAEGRKRSTELLSFIQEMHIKCITWNLCGKYQTPKEAAAADPAQFEKEIQAALKAAEAARIPDDLDAFLDRIQTRRYEPHTTGLQFFDDLLSGGIIDGTTTIVQGPAATGKSTLCLQIAAAMATNKTPVVYLNFEMSNDQMLAKAISCQLAAAGKYYSTTRILQGYTWNTDARETITTAVNKYRETIAPFLTFKPDAVSNDLDAVLDYLQKLGEAAEKAGARAPAVILDYLHIIDTSKRIDTKELIKQVVYGVKRYAAKYNTFAFLISATNRDANKRDTNKKETEKKDAPKMADARDSSNIEFSGDYVIALQAVEETDKEPQRLGDKTAPQTTEWRRMELYLLKNRFGKAKLYTEVQFNMAANYFLPVEGFTPDSGEQQIVMGPPPKRKRL